MGRPKVLLFDLGGVLIEFVGLIEIRKLLDHDPGPDAIRHRWMTSRSILRFERGECSPDEFSRSFVEEWGLSIEPASFLTIFRSWVRRPFPGVESFLSELRPTFVVACLSNTNEVHWTEMLELYGLRHHFDRHYASHLIGAVKPEPEVFAFVSGDLGYAPSDIAFFDDGLENVQGARQAGLHAYRVEGLQDLRSRATNLGILGAHKPGPAGYSHAKGDAGEL